MDAIQLPNFRIFTTPEQAVWIQRTTGPAAGEGGQFDLAELEKVIAEFYEENF